MVCRLVEVSFVVRFDLVSFPFGKARVGVLGVFEGVYRLLVESSSRYGTLEVLHDGGAYGSLVPYHSSGVGDREGVIGRRVASRSNHAEIEGLGNLGGVSDTGGVTGFAGVSSYREESYGTEYGKYSNDYDKLDESEPF